MNSCLQLYMRFWQNILALNICKLGNKCCFWSRHLAALVSSLLNKQSRLVMRLITHYCFLTRWSSTFFNLRRKMNPWSNPFFFLVHGDWYVLIKAVFIFSFRTKCVACQTDQSSSNDHVHLSWHPRRRRRLETFGKNAIKEPVRAFDKKTFLLGYTKCRHYFERIPRWVNASLFLLAPPKKKNSNWTILIRTYVILPVGSFKPLNRIFK